MRAERERPEMKDLTVTLVQLSAGTEVAANLTRVTELLRNVSPADLTVLPEVFTVRGGDADYRQNAEPIPGPATDFAAALARGRREWVLAGSVVEKCGRRIYNTSVLLNRRGKIAARYRKIHLFAATLDTGQVVREDETFRPGSRPVLADVDGWRCGLSICYDLRFPELFRRYAHGGARVLLIPANFTQRTGKDHWEVLLRARAIENQCYVVAPGQCGTNERTGVESYGHSMVVDPWGRILARAARSERVLTVRLEAERIRSIRLRIPVLEHWRLDRPAERH